MFNDINNNKLSLLSSCGDMDDSQYSPDPGWGNYHGEADRPARAAGALFWLAASCLFMSAESRVASCLRETTDRDSPAPADAAAERPPERPAT